MSGTVAACPDCGMPRHRYRTARGWLWSPCGPCAVFGGWRA